MESLWVNKAKGIKINSLFQSVSLANSDDSGQFVQTNPSRISVTWYWVKGGDSLRPGR